MKKNSIIFIEKESYKFNIINIFINTQCILFTKFILCTLSLYEIVVTKRNAKNKTNGVTDTSAMHGCIPDPIIPRVITGVMIITKAIFAIPTIIPSKENGWVLATTAVVTVKQNAQIYSIMRHILISSDSFKEVIFLSVSKSN